MQRSSLLLCLLAILITTTDGFVVRCNRAIQTSPAIEIPIDNGSSAVVGKRGSALSMGLFDDFGKMLKGMTARASASHILIKGGAEAAIKLEELKAEIADSPVKFADLAAEYSSCPSGRSGGTLGEFGRGQMVKEFDEVVFNDEVGVVHGPIKTQFGYHLILINERSP